MRTTVTLDPDVVHLLKRAAHEKGESFKRVLNESVRRAFRIKPNRPKPFQVKARSLGLRPGIDPARLTELADEMETEAFLAVTQRLRKKAR
jgi:hypothetical protein